jgi:enamine deaminase RidA (YjgF/YER057c/UK114 family)
MNRTAINPTDWSLKFGFNQGELLENPSKLLVLSGQVSIDDNGRPQHAGDMTAQIGLALDNIEAAAKQAGMTLSNVVRVTMFTTDMDAMLGASPVLGERFKQAGITPAQTMIGVSRLAMPDLLIELEAILAA